ncbi:MAG TPA: M28 family peptidase [bacterium]|nr:M28 family peptidase [bacterium]
MIRGWRKVLLLLAAAGLAAGCAAKSDKYKIKDQAPAPYITPERSAADIVKYGEGACALPGPFEGAAIDYLQVLAGPAGRLSGSQGYRCAAAFVRDTLKSFGYQVDEVPYTFPYYDFDLGKVKVTRARDNKDFPAFPMHYSAPAKGTLTGKLIRPRPGSLEGSFIYVKPSMFASPDLKPKYVEWKKRGALGVIREASMRPEGAKGNRHPARAHATSWRYAPLPGFVVEDAAELIGETITVTGEARIVQGTGYDIVARSKEPASSYVLITAHLDCWFTGALDDGSGAAALLEIARLMKDDNRGVIFLFVDSEEIWLIGSGAYVQKFGTGNISAVIELDMVSSLNNFGRDKTPENAGIMPRAITYTTGLKPYAKNSLGGLAGRKLFVPPWLNLLVNHGGFRTDYEWFFYEGVPGVLIYTPSKYYHQELDTLDWIPPDDLQDVAVRVADLTRTLRDQGDLPRAKTIAFNFEARMGDGDSVELSVTLAQGQRTKPSKVVVNSYFEQGFEDKVELKKADDGVWRGEYQPPWPGDWEFLAAASRGRTAGKRWVTLKAPKK